MAVRVPLVEQIRARLMERIERVRALIPAIPRIPFAGRREYALTAEKAKRPLAGEIVGAGKWIDWALKRVEQVTAMIAERRPRIIETVTAKLEAWRPGAKIAEVIPEVKVGERTPTPGARKYKLK